MSELVKKLRDEAARVSVYAKGTDPASTHNRKWAADLRAAAERIEADAARIEKLEAALRWIDHHYANQDMSHQDFRVEAAFRVRAALTPTDGGSK